MSLKLRNIRLSKGYTDVEKLSKKIGISASHYYKIEQGVRTPSIGIAKKIADVLGETMEDIFFNQELDESSKFEQIKEVS